MKTTEIVETSQGQTVRLGYLSQELADLPGELRVLEAVEEIARRVTLGKQELSASQLAEKFGGRYLALGGPFDIVEGDWRPVFPVIIEFPTLEQAHRWYDSPEYRELKALRLAATKCNAVFIEGR